MHFSVFLLQVLTSDIKGNCSVVCDVGYNYVYHTYRDQCLTVKYPMKTPPARNQQFTLATIATYSNQSFKLNPESKKCRKKLTGCYLIIKFAPFYKLKELLTKMEGKGRAVLAKGRYHYLPVDLDGAKYRLFVYYKSKSIKANMATSVLVCFLYLTYMLSLSLNPKFCSKLSFLMCNLLSFQRLLLSEIFMPTGMKLIIYAKAITHHYLVFHHMKM